MSMSSNELIENDSIWTDVEFENSGFDHHQEDSDDDGEVMESIEVDDTDFLDSSIPESMLNYFLSTERGNRMKKIRSLSIRNKTSYYPLNRNTKRNVNSKHSITPKRKRKNGRMHGGGRYKKTKRIIHLNSETET